MQTKHSKTTPTLGNTSLVPLRAAIAVSTASGIAVAVVLVKLFGGAA